MDAFLKTGKLSSKDKDSSRQPKKGGDTSKKRLLPWVEKYRPKKIEDVASQEEVVEVLKKSLEGADLPNLLFYGPPGTGKTSTILAAARELFGDLYHQRVLELNASDERGIQVIREKVKNFSQLSASGVREDGRRCPPFKIVILDEADSMTGAAQAALRRTMESQTKSTRFCLVCNYVSRIIEPLTSRCSKFRFKPLSRDVLINRLRYICDSENLKCDTGALLTLVDTCEGDLRRAITSLQCLSALHPRGTSDEEQGSIVSDDVYDITGTIPLDVLEDLISSCMKGTYDQCESQVASFLQKGFSAYQFLLQLQERLVEGADFSDKQKSVLAEKLAVCDQRLIDGADEYLQLMDVCCAWMEARNI